MAIQLAEAIRNARLDAIEATIGANAIMKIRTGNQPANVATADAGTVLATISLGLDWMAAASGGQKAMSGTWQDAAADADGTAAHFRIYGSDGTTAYLQGSVTLSGAGGDLQLNNTNLVTGQPVEVTSFTLTDGNA